MHPWLSALVALSLAAEPGEGAPLQADGGAPTEAWDAGAPGEDEALLRDLELLENLELLQRLDALEDE